MYLFDLDNIHLAQVLLYLGAKSGCVWLFYSLP